MQRSDIQSLTEAISDTSDEVAEKIEVTGKLVGGDLKSKSFHFEVTDADDIRGAISESFGNESKLHLGSLYDAVINRTTRIKFATETECVDYELVSLTPVGTRKN